MHDRVSITSKWQKTQKWRKKELLEKVNATLKKTIQIKTNARYFVQADVVLGVILCDYSENIISYDYIQALKLQQHGVLVRTVMFVSVFVDNILFIVYYMCFPITLLRQNSSLLTVWSVLKRSLSTDWRQLWDLPWVTGLVVGLSVQRPVFVGLMVHRAFFPKYVVLSSVSALFHQYFTFVCHSSTTTLLCLF